MPKGKLYAIPKPDEGTRTVFVLDNNSPDAVFISGQGKWDYACAKCGRELLRKLVEGQVKAVVFLCPSCGTYNDTERPAN